VSELYSRSIINSLQLWQYIGILYATTQNGKSQYLTTYSISVSIQPSI